MAEIIFGNTQKKAIQMASEWIRESPRHRKGIFVIAGYAGTGKSTVLSQILSVMGIPVYSVAFATYTGKAAVVLRQKGHNAYTLHRLIYNTGVSQSGMPIFRRKKSLPSGIELICVDEVGMVPEKIMNDLLSFNVPVLALGDQGQLPPIYGENSFISNPDCILTEIYRQNEGSGVLKFATDIRNGIFDFENDYGNQVKIISSSKFRMEYMKDYEQMLCGTNATRSHINVQYRALTGKKSPFPEKGEKLICIVNNFKDPIPYKDIDYYFVNGLMAVVTRSSKEISDSVLYIRLKPDGLDKEVGTYCKRGVFLNDYEDFGQKAPQGSENDVKNFYDFYNDKIVNSFTFGQVITGHKSQGSQYDSVLIFDDCFYNSEINYRRWLYTCVTRAINRVMLVEMD
jgi:ATP-dependent exoDNAse (exonuclease V) alpha subunit